MLQREPAGQTDHARRRAHRLDPAVDAPEDEERDEQQARAAAGEAEHAHDQVDHGRDEEPPGHETADVAVIRDEPVDEFADGIDEKQGRPDQTELAGREDAPVNQRLLDHAHGHPADIEKTVGNGHAPERTGAEPVVNRLDLPFGDLPGGRFRNPEITVKSHGKREE